MTSFTSVIILELPSQIKPALLEQTIREETLPKLASQAGCLQTWWGTSRVLPRQLLVFIEWETFDHASIFISSFGQEVLYELACRFNTQPASSPSTFEMIPTIMGACDPSPDCVVSVYFLEFDALWAKEEGKTVLFELDQFRQHLQKHDGFEGMTKGWKIQESSSADDPRSSQSLLVIIGWSNLIEAEFRRGMIEFNAEISELYRAWFQPLLDVAQPGWTKQDIFLHLFIEGLEST